MAVEQLTSKGVDFGVMELAKSWLKAPSMVRHYRGQDQQLALDGSANDHAKVVLIKVHNDSDWEVPSDDYWLQFVDEFVRAHSQLQTITLRSRTESTPAKAFATKDEPTKRAMMLMQRSTEMVI